MPRLSHVLHHVASMQHMHRCITDALCTSVMLTFVVSVHQLHALQHKAKKIDSVVVSRLLSLVLDPFADPLLVLVGVSG